MKKSGLIFLDPSPISFFLTVKIRSVEFAMGLLLC